MLGKAETVTLFGRFRLLPRTDIERLLAQRDIQSVKDLTRRTTVLAIGSGATNLISGGALSRRLTEARDRGIPVLSERRLLDRLHGASVNIGTLPVGRFSEYASEDLVDLLNAFGLISLVDGKVRFQDADALRNAGQLEARGMQPTRILEALALRMTAPHGRHRIGVDAYGQAVLEWEDGLTTFSGQGMLPLGEAMGLDDLFDAGMEAEARGDLSKAQRLYEACARADRRDPVALYNLGNVCMALGDEKAAQLAFERAIARDPEFAEARFNLAGLLESQGAQNAALEELRKTVEIAPDFPDALFNLAQIELATGDLDAAEARFRDYISLTGSDGWQEKARKALQLIKLRRSSSNGGTAKETG